MKTIGTDPDGHPIPGVPEPGDRIRVLWSARDDMPQHWDDAYLVRIDPAGIWWVPAEDATGAYWVAWDHIVSIEGPLA